MKRTATKTSSEKDNTPSAPSTDQAAYSPAHFAARFGRSPVWAYRLLYAGKVKAITGFGRILIPHSELERLLATAAIYEGEAA
jgi:hypothetical protein